jgi:precorrin-3B synthase
MANAGFIVSPEDPRLAIVTCSGASGCERGTTATHEDAMALAPLARHLQKTGIAMHISGCAKGCVRPLATPFTMVANAGLYDLVRDGTARDLPHATGLSLAEVRDQLTAKIQETEKEPS